MDSNLKKARILEGCETNGGEGILETQVDLMETYSIPMGVGEERAAEGDSQSEDSKGSTESDPIQNSSLRMSEIEGELGAAEDSQGMEVDEGSDESFPSRINRLFH
ncbi:PREDICTED: uncharacterized protein LOC104587782 [Nelumbo nucifera]|uniref:Uncharacterized protein n=2 Tax=Nelumbo nucifera TaxID=4432 RepID=A0A822YKC4_NELNU|nr:PREDICTED: uncharacterized protein LOC104587782 [Nelumbo nucifera]DAD32001.1 TPA_asm: hypothetical protein HUJ06_010852 [Nelumbo nucifera]